MQAKRFLGLAKTMYNANVSELVVSKNSLELKTILLERLSRKKWDGAWPLKALQELAVNENDYTAIVENRDLSLPSFKEELYQKQSPFYEMIESLGLEKCLSQRNANLAFMGHHTAHAYSSLFQSPFEKCHILIMDGGGSRASDYNSCSFSQGSFLDRPNEAIEHTSLFYWNGKELECLEKEFLSYESYSDIPYKIGEGIGSFYERCAQLIFNDNLSSGKVMGLAAFGESFFDPSLSLIEMQCKLDWKRAFKGKSKKEWQDSPHKEYWQNVAATVQEAFEYVLGQWVSKIGHGQPLIFSGGCALNCVGNFKIAANWGHKNFFVPVNPGDEGIAQGLAYGAYLQSGGKPQITSRESMTSSFSPVQEDEIGLFGEFNVLKLGEDFSPLIKCLEEERAVAWFEGRSESGQRALGHRSLLANCSQEEIKKFLNQNIKFREDFRPYGASVLWEDAHHYFDCPEGFHNSFMSYAVPIKEDKMKLLQEVAHIDGTCRMQTVHKQAHPIYHKLLEAWKEAGHEPILLNTSLNIMGEPIIEKAMELREFFEKSPLNSIVYNGYLIQKVKSV